MQGVTKIAESKEKNVIIIVFAIII